VSSIVTDQGIVHYERHGSGPPVVLLHGWLGSWETWRTTIKAFEHEYRAYALDFWGFGESGKDRESFRIADFVELVDQFMDRLGIESAPVVGHSMGGTTALGVALQFPKRVTKIAVVGAPIQGKSLNIGLQLAGNPLIASVVWNSPALFRLLVRVYAPLVSHVAPGTFYEMMVRNSSQSRATLESFFHSIASLRQTDLTPLVPNLHIPALGVYGARDVIVSPKQSQVFQANVPNGKVVYMRGVGHFPMLDAPDAFNQALRDFLSA
jgi:pimeloyl-ACP methyl ester carboxylesterase